MFHFLIPNCPQLPLNFNLYRFFQNFLSFPSADTEKIPADTCKPEEHCTNFRSYAAYISSRGETDSMPTLA